MTTMTEEKFWSIVDDIGWGTKTTDDTAVKKKLMRSMTVAEVNAMRAFFDEFSHKLYKTLDHWQRDPNQGEGNRYLGSDDGMSDLIAHIVGQGKAEFDAVRADPLVAKRRADADYGTPEGYTESFSYCIPYEDDFEKLEEAHYVQWAKRLLDQGYPAPARDSYGHEPGKLQMTIDLDADLNELRENISRVKADVEFLTGSLRMLAEEGNLTPFRGEYGKAACEAVKRIDKACPSPHFHPAAITNLVLDIARYIDDAEPA